MTTECHKVDCPKHSCHYDPDGGPFCDEEECIEPLPPMKPKQGIWCIVCGGVVINCLCSRCGANQEDHGVDCGRDMT